MYHDLTTYRFETIMFFLKWKINGIKGKKYEILFKLSCGCAQCFLMSKYVALFENILLKSIHWQLVTNFSQNWSILIIYNRFWLFWSYMINFGRICFELNLATIDESRLHIYHHHHLECQGILRWYRHEVENLFRFHEGWVGGLINERKKGKKIV